MAAMEQGADLQPWTREAPAIRSHECLIKVRSCGICHSDIHMIDNDWGTSRYPLVPGHEVVGEVVECGDAVRGLRPGTRVGIGWQSSSCGTCMDCLRGDENLCDRSEGLIVQGYGGFSAHVVVDARFAFPIPDGIETDEAGPLLCGGATVYSALRYAGMRGGQEIGVIGIGGLGHMAVQFAARLGNRVTVFTSSPDKAEFAATLGAVDAVMVGEDGRPQTKRRFDIILNTAPRHLAWNSWLNRLDSDGTLTFVGIPGGAAEIELGVLLGKRRRIMASAIGSPAVITEMLSIADRFGVRPMIETFPLEEVNRALQRVRDNTVRYRAVVKVA